MRYLQLIFLLAHVADAQGPRDREHVQVLISLLSGGDAKDRREAAHELGRMGHVAAPAAGALVQLLDDHDVDTRDTAGWALRKIGQMATGPVVRGLKSRSALVRFECALLLSYGEPFALDKHRSSIAKALKDRDADVRRLAAKALVHLGGAGVTPLVAALTARHKSARRDAARALGEIGQPAIPELIRKLRTKPRDTRAAAAQALGMMPPAARPDGLEPLCAALADKEAIVRREAARALGAYTEEPAKVMPLLAERLADPDIEVARVVGAALARFGVEALPQLEAAFDANGPHIAAGLAAAFRALKDKGVPALERALHGPHHERAALAAGHTGAWARSLLARLDELGTKTAQAAAVAIRRSIALAKDCSAAEELLAKKPAQALPRLEEAHHAGNVRATYVLGRHNLALDVRVGSSLLLEASGADYAPAMEALGDLYQRDRYRDLKRALHWYERAAKKGVVRAMVLAANLLRKKSRRNDAKAMELYERAAAKGSVAAMKGLAHMWRSGHSADPGVTKSSWSEAGKWMRKAAIRGDHGAMYSLSSLYAPPVEYATPVVTYAWAALAAEGKGHEREWRKKHARRLYEKLTRVQREEAKSKIAALREEMKTYE